jgi:hypothetical protein
MHLHQVDRKRSSVYYLMTISGLKFGSVGPGTSCKNLSARIFGAEQGSYSTISLSARRITMIPCSIVPYPKPPKSSPISWDIGPVEPPRPASVARTDMLGLSLFSMGTRFSDVVIAMMRVLSGVTTKSVTWRLENDHWRRIAPLGL